MAPQSAPMPQLATPQILIFNMPEPHQEGHKKERQSRSASRSRRRSGPAAPVTPVPEARPLPWLSRHQPRPKSSPHRHRWMATWPLPSNPNWLRALNPFPLPQPGATQAGPRHSHHPEASAATRHHHTVGNEVGTAHQGGRILGRLRTPPRPRTGPPPPPGAMMNIAKLQAMAMPELNRMAKEMGIENFGTMRKHELIFQILQKNAERAGVLFSEGVLEICPKALASCAPAVSITCPAPRTSTSPRPDSPF